MKMPDNFPWREVVAQAVHDLSTPLATLRTSLEILRLTSSDPEAAAKAIGILEAQIDMLTTQLVALRDNPGSILKG